MQYLTLAGLTICALVNLYTLFGIHRRLENQREMNARHLKSQQEILDTMIRLHHEERSMHERQMKSNADLFATYTQVLDAYRRIKFWHSR